MISRGAGPEPGTLRARCEGWGPPVGGGARCDGMLLHARFENRGDNAAGAACGVRNTIESGDYSITEFISEK